MKRENMQSQRGYRRRRKHSCFEQTRPRVQPASAQSIMGKRCYIHQNTLSLAVSGYSCKPSLSVGNLVSQSKIE